MKTVRLELVAPIPREQFMTIYDGDEFRNYVIQHHPHVSAIEVVERREDENTRFIRTRTTMSIEAPGFLKLLTSAVQPQTEEEQIFFKKEWRYEFRGSSSVSRSRARIELVPEGEQGTRRIVNLELEATRGPGFLRSRAEDYFVEKAREQMGFYGDIVKKYIAEKFGVSY